LISNSQKCFTIIFYLFSSIKSENRRAEFPVCMGGVDTGGGIGDDYSTNNVYTCM
jgi:hypothetical protein